MGSGIAVAGALDRVAGETVLGGPYAITQGTVTDANNSNYLITYVGANLTIGQRAVTVTAAAQSKTYGNADPGLTYQVTLGNLVGTDTLSGGLIRVAGENVGTYAINRGTVDNANYAITYVGANLTIGRAPLLVIANDASETYDGLAFFGGNGVTYSGFVNSETEAVLGGTLVYGGDSQGAINAGSYVISVSGLTSGNYDISYGPGTLVILPGPATVVAGAFEPGAAILTPENFLVSVPQTDQVAACDPGAISAALSSKGKSTLTDEADSAACGQ